MSTAESSEYGTSRIPAALFGVLALAAGLCPCFPAAASSPALFWLARREPADRSTLLKAGVSLVRETPSGYLALGEEGRVTALLASLGYAPQRVDTVVQGNRYYALAAPEGAGSVLPAGCGDVLLVDGQWALVKTQGELGAGCGARPPVFLAPVDLIPLGMPRPPPPEYAPLQERLPAPLEVQAGVFDVLAQIGPGDAVSHWDGIIGSAGTRHSQSPGCVAAADHVLQVFQGLGLEASLQTWSPAYAPNVLAVIPGQISPERVVVAIAHLDDMPPYGKAPGADDNASGCAMVLTAAQALAPFSLASTVKLLAVTGEEQGLLGSSWYAGDAASRGEQIVAVLNADMIGWQGSDPGSEDLDVDCDENSLWLGTLFARCAAEYPTGCTVDAFRCPMEASDHAPFWHQGYSAVCGITDNEGYCGREGHYPYYHTGADTRKNCGDPAFFEGAVRAYVATLAHLASPLCRRSAPPSGMAAAPAGGGVLLTWAPSEGAAGYLVERARGSCGGASDFVPIAETLETAYWDLEACGGISYAYRVRAMGDATRCESPPSACAGAWAGGSCTYPTQGVAESPTPEPPSR